MTVKIIAGLGMTSVEVARIDNICTCMRYAVVLRETNRADIMYLVELCWKSQAAVCIAA